MSAYMIFLQGIARCHASFNARQQLMLLLCVSCLLQLLFQNPVLINGTKTGIFYVEIAKKNIVYTTHTLDIYT